MNYIEIKPKNNTLIKEFFKSNDLFTSFNAPVNIIFIDNFMHNINLFKDIFSTLGMTDNIFFSCKANKSYAFLKTAAECNCGIEVSSYYELKDALKYTNKIIASGPAKSNEYISLAIKNECVISVDDIEELKNIVKVKEKKKVKVLLRISNLVNTVSRFGINISSIQECVEYLKKNDIELLGFSFHINNYKLDDRVKAVEELLNIVNKYNLNIKYIDIGGGLPVNYCDKEQFNEFKVKNNKEMYFRNKDIMDFYPYYNEMASGKALEYILKSIKNKLGKIEIIIEPGRSLLDDCGISIYKVEYTKHLENGDYIIVTNGNINCLSEQWFNTDYLIEPEIYYKGERKKETIFASVAGNLCLEQDMITWRKLKFEKIPKNGDYLIYFNTAGYQMDSNESEFHKIPIVEKYVIKKEESKFIIKEDKEYGSK